MEAGSNIMHLQSQNQNIKFKSCQKNAACMVASSIILLLVQKYKTNCLSWLAINNYKYAQLFGVIKVPRHAPRICSVAMYILWCSGTLTSFYSIHFSTYI